MTIADFNSGTNNLTVTPNQYVLLSNLLEGPTNSGDNSGSRILRRWNLGSAKIHFFSQKMNYFRNSQNFCATSIVFKKNYFFVRKNDFCEKQWMSQETIEACNSNELLLSNN